MYLYRVVHDSKNFINYKSHSYPQPSPNDCSSIFNEEKRKIFVSLCNVMRLEGSSFCRKFRLH